MINVTVWNENVHETDEKIGPIMADLHPNGIHGTVADIVKELGAEVSVRTATLDQPLHGLSDEVLDSTDVLIWWGHCAHDKVSDEIVAKVKAKVLGGMGIIILHSGHYSKIFKDLMGTSCDLRWKEDCYGRVFCVNPSHPIADGIPANFELGVEECYGEYFDIPIPDEVIFESWFNIGEVFRSGCTFTRGYGKIFYFQPGHETNPSYHNKYVRRIIQNAVLWANSPKKRSMFGTSEIKVTLEEIRNDSN